MLNEKKQLDKKHFDSIWKEKQKFTSELILKETKRNLYLISLCKYIKNKGWKLACASNAINETIIASLSALGILEFFDTIASAEFCQRAKPYPEMYWHCMSENMAIPQTTIIIEDSHIGRQGAIDSGAHLLAIENPHDLTREKVMNKMDDIIDNPVTSVPWRDKKLTVLIPMAGAGSRFAEAGYTFPKPLIEVNGKTMIQTVVDNLNIDAHYVFIVSPDHYEKYNLKSFLKVIAPGCDVVIDKGPRKGAAVTTLKAKNFINNNYPLLIVNSDQYIEWNSNECMYAFTTDKIDGGILTFEATHPKWSYAKLGEDGFVSKVAEKEVISNLATVGVYFWKKGNDYVKYAEQMIKKKIKVNNEFYVCPVFNEAIEDGKKIRTKTVSKMWGLGTPEDLDTFLRIKKK